MTDRGWIGVDLDSTLAHYDEWQGVEHIGEPIEPMLARVKRWLADGEEVRIFTARVGPQCSEEERAAAERAVELWCLQHLNTILPVTASKDYLLKRFYDDRAVAIETNTGRILGGVE